MSSVTFYNTQQFPPVDLPVREGRLGFERARTRELIKQPYYLSSDCRRNTFSAISFGLNFSWVEYSKIQAGTLSSRLS